MMPKWKAPVCENRAQRDALRRLRVGLPRRARLWHGNARENPDG
jgi:hypothetical protein